VFPLISVTDRVVAPLPFDHVVRQMRDTWRVDYPGALQPRRGLVTMIQQAYATDKKDRHQIDNHFV
jgi:hypothetical protein